MFFMTKEITLYSHFSKTKSYILLLSSSDLTPYDTLLLVPKLNPISQDTFS